MSGKGPKELPVKLSSVVNASRYVPSTSASSLIVAVRVRPLLKTESIKAGKKDIMRVMDGKVVIVLDPDETKEYLDVVQNRTKEKRYTFDVAFPPTATNEDVYNGTIRDLVVGVLYGINTTVFAYGATGSGKTYTMVGGHGDPGLMILSLQRIFEERERLFSDEDFEVQCAYCEVYNEVIYDLLVKNSGPLELREDPEQGVQVAGLKHITVASADDILDLLEDGNKRRKTESTDANAQSSRSHAVLEITIKRTPRNHYRVQQLRAKLSLVDLAGSERAADTNNAGQKLRDGANINRSLLALANCINALGKLNGPSNKSASYVPYRNSKLTRLLKDGLSGNSRTAMITTVSAAADQYHHSIGTLKYADRAKEIKTHVVQNVGTVESHVSDYQRIIDNLQCELQDLKSQLAERPSPAANGVASSENDVLAFIDILVQEMNDNIEERINLQKALFEIEDANVYNKYELKQLDDFLEGGQGSVKDITEARDRRTDVLQAVKENEKERDKYKAEIAENEEDRRNIQARVDQLTHTNQNVAFLNLMSTFRLQAVRLQELKFQMAVRDQIISEQREVIANLWRILDKSGMGRTRVLEIAKQEGIIMDGFFPFSEEPTRGPTPPHGAQGKGGLNGLRVDVKLAGRPGAGAGGDGLHAATPNASLAGNRAKMRYRFWAQYQGDNDGSSEVSPSGVNDVGGGGGGIGNEGASSSSRRHHREREKDRAARRGRRRGGGDGEGGVGRDASVPPPSPRGGRDRGGDRGSDRGGRQHPASGRDRGVGGGGGGGGGGLTRDQSMSGHSDRPSYQPVSRLPVPNGDGGREGRPSYAGADGRPSYAGAVGGGGAGVSGIGAGGRPGAHRAIAGAGNNQTVPTVRQGRRAGQPIGARPEDGEATIGGVVAGGGGGGGGAGGGGDFSFDLPRSQYNGVTAQLSSDVGGGAAERARRHTEAWGNGGAAAAHAAANAAAAGIAPRPSLQQQQQGLNDRLAKLKQRLGGRRTEDSGAMGLPVGGTPGVPGSGVSGERDRPATGDPELPAGDALDRFLPSR